jgi:nitrogenase molybdenum-cofactor synthesis protein NifE
MVSVRRSVYSLLEKMPRKSTSVNIMGYFSPLCDDCELYELLHQAGIKNIREISRLESFEEYKLMAEANFNLVLDSEARYAAEDLYNRLGIPSIELFNLHSIEKIRKQYTALSGAINCTFDDEKFYRAAAGRIGTFAGKFNTVNFAVGEWLNADSFELSLSLLEMGLRVSEIYGTIGE